MKRALALLAGLGLFGFAGLAQFSGEWTGTLTLLPTTGLSTKLTLNYEFASGWTLTSVSKFDDTNGWTYQQFSLSGTVGPFAIDAWGRFDPESPAWMGGELGTKFDFAGVTTDITIRQWAYDYFGTLWPSENDPCAGQTYSSGMMYIFETTVEPLTIETTFVDCCTGIEFNDITITLSDVSLCCGITYDVELYFTKAGFQYVEFTVDPLVELCCGISMGVTVKFGVDYKEVSPSFSWGGIEGCVTLYGDLMTDGTTIYGFDIYGYKIYCELAECNYLEFVTAFDPTWYNTHVADVFEDDEFEYVKLGFCGPSCCGGNWSANFQIFFVHSGPLFGANRLAAELTVPVMDNLSFTVSYETPDSFSVGWDFTF